MAILPRILSKYYASLYMAALLLGLIFFCPIGAHAISVNEEEILGREFMANIKAHYTFLDDQFANRYMNELGQYLLRPLETRPFRFHFYIINNDTLNAFAAPGGNIFIFSGLLNLMDTVDQLGGVIAHEIGHVAARHLSQRIDQSKKIGLATLAAIFAGALLGGEAVQAITAGSMAAGIQAQLHYSRQDERQADQLGFKYATAAGFNPKGLIEILSKMDQKNWMGPKNIPPYLLTHPTGPERIANLESMISNYTPSSPKKEYLRLKRLFPIFKIVVLAKTSSPESAKKRFERSLKKNPRSPLAHFGMGIACMRNQEYQKAVDYLEKAAHSLPNAPPVLKELGRAYQYQGDNEHAKKIFERLIDMDPDDTEAQYLLAITYENLEQWANALSILKALASFSPVKPDTYYHLGYCYGKENRLARAHFYFGLYFRTLGKENKARFHFNEAYKLAGDDNRLKEKIQKVSRNRKDPSNI